MAPKPPLMGEDQEEKDAAWKPLLRVVERLTVVENPTPHGYFPAARMDKAPPLDTTSWLQKADKKGGEIVGALFDGTKESIDEWKNGGPLNSPRTPAGKPGGRTPDGRG
jgi:hypothetical protein